MEELPRDVLLVILGRVAPFEPALRETCRLWRALVAGAPRQPDRKPAHLELAESAEKGAPALLEEARRRSRFGRLSAERADAMLLAAALALREAPFVAIRAWAEVSPAAVGKALLAADAERLWAAAQQAGCAEIAAYAKRWHEQALRAGRGGVFTLIANDGRVDRMLMATDLLNQRIQDVMAMRRTAGEANGPRVPDEPRLVPMTQALLDRRLARGDDPGRAARERAARGARAARDRDDQPPEGW